RGVGDRDPVEPGGMVADERHDQAALFEAGLVLAPELSPLMPVARTVQPIDLNSPEPVTFGLTIDPSSSIGVMPGTISAAAGAGCTSATNVTSKLACFAFAAVGSVTVPFHSRLPVPLPSKSKSCFCTFGALRSRLNSVTGSISPSRNRPFGNASWKSGRNHASFNAIACHLLNRMFLVSLGRLKVARAP